MSFFNEYNIITDILTVCELEWDRESVITDGSKRHFHALSVRLSGDCEIIGEDFSFSLKTGDVLFMPQLTKYRRKSNTAERIISVHFTTLKSLYVPDCFSPKSPESYVRLFSALVSIWTKKEDGYLYESISVLNSILRDIMLEGKLKSISSNNREDIIYPGVQYINYNFNRSDINIEILSKVCNISPSYFRRIFRSVYGVTPIEYIINKRISYATELLSTGYYSVKQVADKCGFENTKYFSALYKKRTGNSPSDIF